MIAKSHTRAGEPVHFGNDPARMPGPENTYQSYGTAWANLSNTPFRLYKHWIHEGGIATPLIVHWPNGIADKGAIRHTPGYLPDIMATILDVTGAPIPTRATATRSSRSKARRSRRRSTRDGVERPPMFWEHEGNAAVRIGQWKLVRNYPGPWELYDMDGRPHRAARPRRAAPGAGRGHGRRVRSVGGALRRDSAREDRRADAKPGRDAGVLGEAVRLRPTRG